MLAVDPRTTELIMPRIALLALASAFVLACDRGGGSGDTSGAGDSATAAANGCLTGAPTLTAGGIGPIRIGSPLSAAEGRCDMRDTSFTLSEGAQENGRVVDLGNGSVVVLTNAQGNVTRIIVEDSTVRAERGLGVGSTVGDLRRTHGMLCAEEGEGVVVVSSGNLGAISFATDADMRTVRRGASLDAEAIPDDARITRMWVYEGRALCGAS